MKVVRDVVSQKYADETLVYVLVTLAKVMAPVMPFLAERVYQEVLNTKESVHLTKWPEGGIIDGKILKDMKVVRDVVSLGLMKRTEHKINVKQPLLSITTKKTIPTVYFDLILDELNVKEVKINESQEEEVVLDTTINDELLQEGDVRKLIRAVQDMRKEKGLSPQDIISVTISSLSNLGDISLLLSTCKIKEVKEDINMKEYSVELSSGVLYFGINN
jgi:isoleucyl-tRNA synthetase